MLKLEGFKIVYEPSCARLDYDGELLSMDELKHKHEDKNDP